MHPALATALQSFLIQGPTIMPNKTILFLHVCMLLVVGGVSQSPAAELDNSLTLFGGQAIKGDFDDWITTNDMDFRDSYQTGLVFNHRFASYPDFSWEVEGQVYSHSGEQRHAEYNAVVVLRWLSFPWDKHLDTSIALGEGLSYADVIPRLEEETHDRAAKLLNFVIAEIELSTPESSHWSAVVRLNHRSGILGLIKDIKGASDFFTFGIRYKF